MLKTIIIQSFLQKNHQAYIKNVTKKAFLRNVRRFSTVVEPTIALSIPRTVDEVILRYTENNHAYKVMRSLPQYKNILYCSNITFFENIEENEFNALVSKNWRLESSTDILNGFKSACGYCRENKITLSDYRFDKLVDGLMDKCQDLTDNELTELLGLIREYPPPDTVTSHNFHDIWSALDDMCCQRHNQWTRDKLLLIADQWYLLGLFRYTDYMKNFSTRIMKKVKHLTPAELVHTLFLINVTRRTIDMFELECRLEKCIDELSVDELGIVSMSFFKTKTPIKGTFIIGQMIDKLLYETTTVNEITLSAILKITRYSPHLTLVSNLQYLLTKLEAEIDRFSTVTCIHLALLGTNAQFLHPASLTKISEKFINNISTVRLKDLERLTFALTLVNFTPPTSINIFEEIQNEISNPSRDLEISAFPRCFTCAIHYLGLKEIYDYKLINKVLNKKFIEKTYGSNPFKFGREILFLDSSIRIDCPDYNGNRLDDKTRGQLTKWTIDRPPRRNAGRRLFAGEILMLDIKEIMENLLGGKEYVFEDFLMPHFSRVDFLMCKDPNGNPVKLNHLQANAYGNIMSAPKDGNTWYVIIPASWNSYVRDSVSPTGILATKMRQLKVLGYIPIMIPWHEFTHLNRTQRDKYIKNKLEL